MQSLLSQTYAWTKKWSNNRFGSLVIFIFLFLDASIFPLPTTVIFITISLIQPSRSYYNTLIATAAMAIGSIVGYSIGHYLWLLPDGNFTDFARFLFNHIPGFTEANYQNAQTLYLNWSYSILFFCIIIPIPYLFFSITAGAFDIGIVALAISTLVFQGFRFLIIAWLITRYGEGVKAIFYRNLKIIALISVVLLLIVLVVTKFG